MQTIWMGFVVVLVAIVCGIAGGVARYFADSKDAGQRDIDQRDTWWSLASIGIVAALIVPLFLKLADSSLIPKILDFKADGSTIESLLVFVGMCLVAGFSARRFLQSVSDRLLTEVNNAKKDARDAKKEGADNKVAINELELNMGDRHSPGPQRKFLTEINESTVSVKDAPTLTGEELHVLSAVFREPYTRRTPQGIAKDAELAKDTGLSFDRVTKLMEDLKKRKLINFVEGKESGRSYYELTPLGWESLRNAKEYVG